MQNNKYIIIDSGFFIALGNANDQYHNQAVELMSNLSKKNWITTWPVIGEVCHLLQRIYKNKAHLFLQTLESDTIEIFSLTKAHMKRIRDLMTQYHDLPMDLADASLVLLAEHIGEGNIISTDLRDFKTYRWKNHHPFENLFFQ